MAAGCRGDNGRKSRMQRNHEIDTGLLLLHGDGAVANVLRPHADHIASTLPGIEQKRRRQSRAGSYGVTLLKLLDLVIGPTMVAVGPDADGPNIAGRIVGT